MAPERDPARRIATRGELDSNCSPGFLLIMVFALRTHLRPARRLWTISSLNRMTYVKHLWAPRQPTITGNSRLSDQILSRDQYQSTEFITSGLQWLSAPPEISISPGSGPSLYKGLGRSFAVLAAQAEGNLFGAHFGITPDRAAFTTIHRLRSI